MVKAIMSSPVVRKAAATVMFATAVIGANASNLKTEESNKNVNQTEVVSKEAALALQSNVVKKNVPLNNNVMFRILNLADNEEERSSMRQSFQQSFNEDGYLVGTLNAQASLDDYCAVEAIHQLGSSDLFKKEAGNYTASYLAEGFSDWKMKNFYPEYAPVVSNLFNRGNSVSAKECFDVLDNFVNNYTKFSDEQKSEYEHYVDIRKLSQSIYYRENPAKYDETQANADLITIKVHAIYDLLIKTYVNSELPNLSKATTDEVNRIISSKFTFGYSKPIFDSELDK